MCTEDCTMHEWTIYTQLCTQQLSIQHTNFTRIPTPFFLFHLQHKHNHLQTQPLTSLYHSGLPAAYQIYVWVVFSSTDLNTLFHFPLSHCLTHKNMPPSCTRTHSKHGSPYSLTRRDSIPHSKSKRLMRLLGQNEIVCHQKALLLRTPV